MRLIKLSEAHYIIVDDSEIEEGAWFYNQPTNYIGQTSRKEGNFWICNNMDGFHLLSQAKKITHSTQPLEAPVAINGFNTYAFISLSEVEELTLGYSVEKMAKYHYGNNRKTREFEDGFMLGFKLAHKELMKDKLFTVEDMRRELQSIATEIATEDGQLSSLSPSLIYSWIENKIQSLLPKTEWEVEITPEGKIILL